ncbi:MAG: TlpA family protein disulfide reductase [Myxococcales bacterium]|nr:TlpA family protein disulfide reductase [Myxococcales bacterium]
MQRRTLLAAALATLALSLSASSASAQVGTAAPEFTLPAAAGHTFRGRFRLGDHLRRRPVVVLFWATWCQPCLQELPVYQSLAQQYGNQLQIVAISMDGPDTVSEAGAAARRLGVTFPVVTDLETQVVSVYNPRRAAPFSVWIDRNGNIVRAREGFSMSEQPQIVSGIAELVGRRPAPATPAAPAPAAPAPAAPAPAAPAPAAPAPAAPR